jgi:hypothetical protein
VVVGVTPEKVAVRVEDAGRQAHVVGGVELRAGEVSWDAPQAWTPCW